MYFPTNLTLSEIWATFDRLGLQAARFFVVDKEALCSRDANRLIAETIAEHCGLKRKPVFFTDKSTAFSFSDRTRKPSRVVADKGGAFLVVCPSDAERLTRFGLSYATR